MRPAWTNTRKGFQAANFSPRKGASRTVLGWGSGETSADIWCTINQKRREGKVQMIGAIKREEKRRRQGRVFST